MRILNFSNFQYLFCDEKYNKLWKESQIKVKILVTKKNSQGALCYFQISRNYLFICLSLSVFLLAMSIPEHPKERSRTS